MALFLGRAEFQQLQGLLPPALDWGWEHQKLAKHGKSLTLSEECLFTGLSGLLSRPRELRNHAGKAAPGAPVPFSVLSLPAEKLTMGSLFVAEFQIFIYNKDSSAFVIITHKHCLSALISTLGAVLREFVASCAPRAARGWKCYWQPGSVRRDVSSCKMRIWSRLVRESSFSNKSMTLKLSGITNPGVNMWCVDTAGVNSMPLTDCKPSVRMSAHPWYIKGFNYLWFVWMYHY